MQDDACDSRLRGWVTLTEGAQVAGMQNRSTEGALVVHEGLVGEWPSRMGNRLLGSYGSRGPVLVRYVSMHGSHASNEGWWQS